MPRRTGTPPGAASLSLSVLILLGLATLGISSLDALPAVGPHGQAGTISLGMPPTDSLTTVNKTHSASPGHAPYRATTLPLVLTTPGARGRAVSGASFGESPGEWANVSVAAGPGPSDRAASMTWDTSDGYALLYGGLGCNFVCSPGDTWTFENGAWSNITSSVTGAPPHVHYSGLAYDPADGGVILFGGRLPNGSFSNETWSYHAKTWTNLTSTAGGPPPYVTYPAMVTDTTDQEIVMTGGSTAGNLFHTWVFKGGRWADVTSVAGPAGRLNLPSGSDDPADRGVLLFGSYAGAGGHPQEATWLYTSGTWRNLTPTLNAEPPAMNTPVAAFLPGAHEVVASSGDSYDPGYMAVPNPTTWVFASGAWANVTATAGLPPDVLSEMAGAVDPASGGLLAFGGQTPAGYLSPFTYVLSSIPLVAATATPAVTEAGLTVRFAASVLAGFAPNTVRWNFGDASANSTGSTTTHAYVAAGLFGATVTVTSWVGFQGTTTIAVYASPALAANATVLGSSTAGAPTGFAVSVTGGISPYTYAWSFGDNGTSSVASATHTFAVAGTYSVSVRVTDALGANMTRSFRVVVAAAPVPPSTSSGTGGQASGITLDLLVGIVILVGIVAALVGLLLRKPKPPMGTSGTPAGTLPATVAATSPGVAPPPP